MSAFFTLTASRYQVQLILLKLLNTIAIYICWKFMEIPNYFYSYCTIKLAKRIVLNNMNCKRVLNHFVILKYHFQFGYRKHANYMPEEILIKEYRTYILTKYNTFKIYCKVQKAILDVYQTRCINNVVFVQVINLPVRKERTCVLIYTVNIQQQNLKAKLFRKYFTHITLDFLLNSQLLACDLHVWQRYSALSSGIHV